MNIYARNTLFCTAICFVLGLAFLINLWSPSVSEYHFQTVIEYGFPFWLFGCIILNLLVCLVTYFYVRKNGSQSSEVKNPFDSFWTFCRSTFSGFNQDFSTNVSNGSENQEIKELQGSISRIKELQKSGVFSESEAQSKIKELEDSLNQKKQEELEKQIEIAVKATDAYRHLNKLLQSNVITKEEFDLKVKRLHAQTRDKPVTHSTDESIDDKVKSLGRNPWVGKINEPSLIRITAISAAVIYFSLTLIDRVFNEPQKEDGTSITIDTKKNVDVVAVEELTLWSHPRSVSSRTRICKVLSGQELLIGGETNLEFLLRVRDDDSCKGYCRKLLVGRP